MAAHGGIDDDALFAEQGRDLDCIEAGYIGQAKKRTRRGAERFWMLGPDRSFNKDRASGSERFSGPNDGTGISRVATIVPLPRQKSLRGRFFLSLADSGAK